MLASITPKNWKILMIHDTKYRLSPKVSNRNVHDYFSNKFEQMNCHCAQFGGPQTVTENYSSALGLTSPETNFMSRALSVGSIRMDEIVCIALQMKFCTTTFKKSQVSSSTFMADSKRFLKYTETLLHIFSQSQV